MISVDDFLAAVEEIASENPSYRNGGSGTDGTCDCIGLIIGAMQRCGHGKYALHGSNYFARNQTDDLGQVEAHTVGMIVYKAREPDEDGYDLPDRYKSGGQYYNGDLLDYYHVGVVTSVAPLEIVHCTTSGNVNGIKRDTTEKEYRNWKWGGFVKDVDYYSDGGSEKMSTTKGIVKSSDGNPVKLRKDPSTKNPYIAKVPNGAEVTVYEQAQGWSTVSYNGTRGYMMSDFIELEESAENAQSSENVQVAEENSQSSAGNTHTINELYEILTANRELVTADHAYVIETLEEIRQLLKQVAGGVVSEDSVDSAEVNG